MFSLKKISTTIILSSLLLSGCGNNKIESTRPQIKSDRVTAPTNYSHLISVGENKLLVEVVSTDIDRAEGLSNRTDLKDGTGMLFDFTNTENNQPSFWMKDMNFDIDIVWIANNQVIGINKNIPAPKDNSNLPTYPPPGAITHALEVPSGWTDKNEIKIGDSINL